MNENTYFECRIPKIYFEVYFTASENANKYITESMHSH